MQKVGFHLRKRKQPSQSRWNVFCAASLSKRDSAESDTIDDVEQAKQSALRLLSSRMYTRHALEQRLEAKGYTVESVDVALTNIQELGLQSDSEYVEKLARYKWRTAKWAPTRIRMTLRQKGVAADDIDAGMRLAFGDTDCSTSHEDTFEEQPVCDWMGQLKIAARLQFAKSARTDPETRRRRLVHWLLRRGHKWDVVRDVLGELEAEAKLEAKQRAQEAEIGGQDER